jgi:hypothetical protein
MYTREGVERPDLAPGDSILILARGNWLRDDRAGYLCFLMLQTRRDYPGLPLPLYEGLTQPCDRYQPIFARAPARCKSQRDAEVDSCTCARETVRRYDDLVAAREAGREIEFLRESLSDENVLVTLSAMGMFRLKNIPEAAEWMSFLVGHPEYQVRYDLAESLPFFPGGAAVQLGVRLLDDPEPKIQLTAAHRLGRLGDRSVEPVLAEILEDPTRDHLVRAMCLSVLDGMESAFLIPALEKAIANTPDPSKAEGFQIHLEKQRKKAEQKD